MDDEVEADARTSGMKGEGSECSGDSFKSSASDSQLVVVKADTNIKKLHNGDPEHLSSDEECVVEECSSGKVTVHSDEDSENVEKESLDSEEEDFKLHVDVDVSDQEGSDAESSGNRQLEPVRANSAGDSEVIELSAGEDDDCEVVEIKEKERTDKESERRQEEKTGRIENNSVEVVDIDDSAELDKVEMAGSARFVGGKPVEESGNPSPALEDDQNVEECLGAVVARGKDGVALEDDEDLGKCEETDRSSVCEETQLVYPLRLEEKEHILENTGEDDHGVDNYLNKNNINEREEERRQVKESGEEVGDLFRHCDPEVVVTRTLPSSASDECTGETSADLSDSDDFIGFESTEPHIFSKEFCHVEGSGPRDGEIVGTLHVSADTHFFTAEGGEGPSTASGSEAGDSSRLSPVPTESSRCNSPTASSASGDKRGGRKRVSLDLTNPLYMKPFQLGWKRELVYRSAMDSANRRMADVYYYTPTNKKIRSARELLEHVDGVELTTKNFLFTKEPLGLDSSMEKIRDARKSLSLREAAWPKDGKEGKEEGEAPSKPPEKHKPARAAEPTPVPAAAPVPVPEATTPEPALAPAPSAPKSPHSSSSAVALRKAATTPTLRSFPRIKVTPTRTQKEEGGAGKGAVAGKRAQPRPLLPKPRDDLQVGVLPPLWSVKSAPTPTPTPKKAAVSTTWSSAPKGKEQRGRKRAGSGSDEGPPAKQPCKQQCAHSLVHDVCVLYIVMERECRVRRGKEQHGRKRAGSGSDEGPPAKQPCKQQCAHSLVHDVCVLYIVMERECRVRRGKEQRGRKRAGSGSDEGPPAKQQCKQQCAHSLVHDVCVLYNVLQHVFQYLKVQELLRAARVCRLWRDLAQHPSLWASVHMKNSKVSDWQGLATTLSARGTAHLDLRKMLLPQRSEDVAAMWQQFRAVVGRMDGLQRLDLCRCPASVVQHVLTACPRLRTLNATAISCNSISLAAAGGLEHLEELRLKSLSGITLESSLGVLSQLSSLKHLALTTFRNLGQQGVEVIGQLESLELLELGEVNNLAATFPAESLACLGKLRRLRLEKVQGPDTLTFNYLETARSLAQLTQLELVNFDVKPGFDSILASCTNIRKLLIIPTYVTQSATTNRMVLGGVLQLASTLQVFVWGVTHELLRVTELFVDQCDVDQAKKEQLKKGDCIPVLKPVPGIAAVLSPSDAWSCEEKYGGPTPSVEILSLPKLHKLLNVQLPGTRVKLLKIPFHATWRQYLSDMHA
ncbi:uncharacterized protein LOC134540142 isoform X2 [Bacillus rossius redtenbacheri]|uniref:uncharacterized protein LOC134540142 isoform X2 n=1 Tax=Bacillus rossius redtenbacheri TaxID=93214 RepID=UPI002FDC8ABF